MKKGIALTKLASLLSAGLLALSLTAACGDDTAGGGDGTDKAGEGESCEADNDCESDLFCVAAVCEFDSDGDGVTDSVDNCPEVPNPDQTDSDGDGRGNVCDDDDGDGDGDGVYDDEDNCPDLSNPNQSDLDGDGVGDACDEDTDGDGILDDGDGSGTSGDNVCEDGKTKDCDDNCRLTPNTDQSDTDQDGQGDVCDEGSTGDDDCPDPSRTPPPNLTRASVINLESDDAFSFEAIFNNTFPGAGNTENIRVRRGEYAAMRFTTGADWPTPGATGDIDVFVNQPILPNTLTGPSAPRMWSISRCEGDFRTWTNDAGCVQGGPGFAQGSFDFGGSSFLGDPARCGLEPGTTYYLNLMYTDAAPPETEAEHQALETVCRDANETEFEFCGHQVEPARGLSSWE